MGSKLWTFWPAGLALIAAIAVVALGTSRLELPRLSNLALTQSGLPSTYLVLGKTDEQRCFVVGRRDATIRRGDRNQPGRKWECQRLDPRSEQAEPAAWLLRSKRVGEGTVFLVPAMDVPDWTYPFLYDFVRERSQPDLPEVAWTELYVSRIYQGLYLRVRLPFDKRKKDGGSGRLREILSIEDGALTAFDTRFRIARGIYVGAVADGILPEFSEPAPDLAWLAARAPTRDTMFLLSADEPPALTLLPLPVSVRELYALRGAAPAPTFHDARFERWTHGSWRTSATAEELLTDEEWQLLGARFAQYRERLQAALAVQATFEQTADPLESTFLARQLADADLPFGRAGRAGRAGRVR